MNYLKIETNSLVDLVGRNSKNAIDWEKIGTNAKAINLSPIRNQIANIETGVTITILPIIESGKSELFIQECAQWGVIAEVITQQQAEAILVTNTVVQE